MRRWLKRWLKRISLFLFVVLAVVAVGIAWVGSDTLVSPERRPLQPYHQRILDDPAKYGLIDPINFSGPREAPCAIYLPTNKPGRSTNGRIVRKILKDRGMTLPAWGELRGTLVLLHGRLGRKEDHLPIAERFCAAGFACIVWDLPGHGDNPSPHATFGAVERREIDQVVATARGVADLPDPVGLFGISQGGAIALQAMKRNNDYYAVASVAAFSELNPLLERVGSHLKPPYSTHLGTPIALLVRAGTAVRAGFDPGSIRPSEAARSIDRPVYLVHGALDIYVQPHHAHSIHQAIPHDEKTLRVVPNGSHGDVLSKGGNILYSDLAEFFLRNLPQRPDQT